MASVRGDREGYDTAQVCRNGHIITNSADDFPHHRQAHCSDCGQATIMNCEHCQAPIKGSLRGVLGFHQDPAPRFCHACGEPYPWTVAALAAAQELADMLSVTDADKATLKADLEDLVRDTPRTPLAAFRFKQIVARAGKEAPGLFRDLLVNVASSAAMKGMGLG